MKRKHVQSYLRIHQVPRLKHQFRTILTLSLIAFSLEQSTQFTDLCQSYNDLKRKLFGIASDSMPQKGNAP